MDGFPLTHKEVAARSLGKGDVHSENWPCFQRGQYLQWLSLPLLFTIVNGKNRGMLTKRFLSNLLLILGTLRFQNQKQHLKELQ